jgi:negative regulator of sigma E activity
MVGAPMGLRERILAAATTSETAAATAAERLAGHPARPTPGNPKSHRWRRAAWPLAVAAAASLALVVLGPDLLSRRQGQDQAPPFSTPARIIVPRYGEQAGQITPVRFGGIDLGGPSQRSSS